MEIKVDDFIEWGLKEAAVLETKIVYFGYFGETKTFVLGREEESLRMEHKYAGLDYDKEASNASFKTYKGALYAF